MGPLTLNSWIWYLSNWTNSPLLSSGHLWVSHIWKIISPVSQVSPEYIWRGGYPSQYLEPATFTSLSPVIHPWWTAVTKLLFPPTLRVVSLWASERDPLLRLWICVLSQEDFLKLLAFFPFQATNVTPSEIPFPSLRIQSQKVMLYSCACFNVLHRADPSLEGSLCLFWYFVVLHLRQLCTKAYSMLQSQNLQGFKRYSVTHEEDGRHPTFPG